MESKKSMKLFEQNISALEEQVIYILLLRSGKHTYLPELLDVVGQDKMMQLLQLFAGMKFQFPKTTELAKYAKEVTIFFRIRNSPKNQQHAVIRDIAEEYFIEECMIRVIYKKISQLVEQDLQIKL